MKRWVLVWVIVLSNILVFGQHKLDSLEHVIDTSGNDSLRLDTQLKLSRWYRYTNLDRSIHHANAALKLSRKLNDRTAEGDAMFCHATGFLLTSDIGSAMKHYYEALSIFQELNDTNRMANTYNVLGSIFQQTGSYNKAMDCFLQTELFFKAKDNIRGLAGLYNNMAHLMELNEDIEKSLEMYYKAKKLAKKSDDKTMVVLMEINLIKVKLNLNQLDSVETMLDNVYAEAQKLELSRFFPIIQKDFARYYSKSNQLDKAKEHLDIVQDLLGESPGATIHSEIEYEWGLYYKRAGNFPEAIKRFQNAIKLSKATGFSQDYRSCLYQAGGIVLPAKDVQGGI